MRATSAGAVTLASRVLTVLILAIALPGAVAAQIPAGACGDESGGVIIGSITVDDTRGARAEFVRPSASLILEHALVCTTRVVGDSRFEFTDVPPGRYEVSAGSSGSRRVPAVVAPGDTAWVDVLVVPEDVLGRCAERSPECAALLAVEPPDSLSPDERDAFTYWRAALARAAAERAADEEWVACLEPYPDGSLRSAITRLHSEIVPREECGYPPQAERPTHAPTGRPATFLSVEVTEAEDGRLLWLSYYMGPHYGARFRCPLRGEPGEAVIGRCITWAEA